MALLILYYSIVIPLENLKRVLSKEELQQTLAIPNKPYDWRYHDDYLYKETSMSPMDNELIIKRWEDKGLVATEEKNGQKYWKDLCLLSMDSPNDPISYPCDWMEIIERPNDWPNRFANLKGKPLVFPAVLITNQ